MTQVRETTIPFSGFYNSSHDQALDWALELSFSDDRGNVNQRLFDEAYGKVDWSAAHIEYARKYVEAFADKFNLPTLKFKELVSPKYYNYSTDRIFCEISLESLQGIFDLVDKNLLAIALKEQFTSYDGFISHYPNTLDRWPADVAEWDHNQIGTLLAVWIHQLIGGDGSGDVRFGDSEQSQLFDDSGEVVQHIIDNNSSDADRYFQIASYLQQRAERKYRSSNNA